MCFLGAGNIAESLISGIASSERKLLNNIIATDIRKERLARISRKFGIKTSVDNNLTAGNSDIIVLCVKPQQVGEVLSEISACTGKGQLLISIAAGITTGYIEKFLKNTPVIRAMPNICVAVREGITALCKGRFASKGDVQTSMQLFNFAGKTVVLPEKLFDTVTAVSGSGPAYVFYLTEGIIEAAIKLGIDKKAAKMLAVQTVAGAGQLLRLTGEEPKTLRYRVTSPGGTTERAIKLFEKNRLLDIVHSAIASAKKRSRELSI